MYQTIRFEKQDNIAIITINRPEALNALNSTVIGELEQVITQVEQDSTLGCMILTGEGRSFVAGADIGEQMPLDLNGGRKWGQRGSALFRRIEKLEIPTIDGKVKWNLPEGTQPGATFRLKGKGIPSVNGRGRGDQYVTVSVDVPRGLTHEQKEALRHFGRAMGELPDAEEEEGLKGFFDKMKKKK